MLHLISYNQNLLWLIWASNFVPLSDLFYGPSLLLISWCFSFSRIKEEEEKKGEKNMKVPTWLDLLYDGLAISQPDRF